MTIAPEVIEKLQQIDITARTDTALRLMAGCGDPASENEKPSVLTTRFFLPLWAWIGFP